MLLAALVQHVAELGRQLDGIPRHAGQRTGDDLLVRTLPVDVAGVEERDPELEGSVD
jgi:hypothetical protein